MKMFANENLFEPIIHYLEKPVMTCLASEKGYPAFPMMKFINGLVKKNW